MGISLMELKVDLMLGLDTHPQYQSYMIMILLRLLFPQAAYQSCREMVLWINRT